MVNKSHRANTDQTDSHLPSIEEHATALFNTIAKGVADEAAAHGLTYLELAIIRMFQMDSEWTATELALLLSRNTAAISRAVGKLVDAGVLRRRRSQQDRRIVFLTITEEGLAFGRDLRDITHSYERQFTQGISVEDLEICLSTIAKIVANHAALKGSTSALSEATL